MGKALSEVGFEVVLKCSWKMVSLAGEGLGPGEEGMRVGPRKHR